MTITLQAVNELIASLESAGELSIREQKFLKMAKAYHQLAAENVALKSYRDTLDEIKSSLIGGGHGHMAKADMQAQSAVLDVIFDAFDDIETPATDRIVAGIKAEDAEACGRALVTLDDDDFTDAQNICAMVAYQLRDGGNGE